MTDCRVLFLSLLGLLAAGCIHLEQRVQINPNGSGVVTYEYSVAEDVFATLAAGHLAIGSWQSPPAAGLSWFASERAVNEHFTAPEFEVQLYRASRRDGRRAVRIVVLAPNLQQALDTGKLGDFRLARTPEGNWRFASLPPGGPPAVKPSEAEVARLRALCDDLWLRLEVSTPGPVLATTAKDRRERQAVWLFDPATDDSFLRARPRIELVYQGD
ncbi:MAG: hypothetical protein RBU25_05320 [Lentisphaeria bacterium]|nr:hypothetical protein [Lentisphaeria bacterium]